MKKVIFLAATMIVLSTNTYAHSGRTDQNGGHNCSAASIQRGLCTGYHYHSNGRAYLDTDDRLVEITKLDSQTHFHNSEEDGHEALEHGHVHEDKQFMKSVSEPVSSDNS